MSKKVSEMTLEEYQKNREYKRAYYNSHYGKKIKSLSQRPGIRVADIAKMRSRDETTVVAWIRKIPELNGRLKQFRCLGGARFNEKEVALILQVANEIAERFTGESNSHLYSIWKAMRQRCTNPKAKAYKYYGGKGISICPEWKTFLPFREWALTNGYKDGLSIDRIDSDKNYTPENCRWITIKENTDLARKKRYGGKYGSDT
ncbi:MAG: hypothetical protein LBU85_09060 [Treponema sp.]|jgi:hypothetical protein|nr:hypothetical protein [Treponema sp.]